MTREGNGVAISDNVSRIFKKNLRNVCKRKEVSLNKLAEDTNIDKSTLSRYTSTDVNRNDRIKLVSVDAVEIIAEKLGVSPSYLVGWETDIEADVKYTKDILAYVMAFSNKIKKQDEQEQGKLREYIENIADKHDRTDKPRTEIDEWTVEFYNQLCHYSVKEVKEILKEAKEYLESLDYKEDDQDEKGKE